MAEWENVPLDPTTKKKKKQRVNLEPRRPMAARLKKQKVDYEPHRPTAARLINMQFHVVYDRVALAVNYNKIFESNWFLARLISFFSFFFTKLELELLKC